MRSPTLDHILDLLFTQGVSDTLAEVLGDFPGSDHELVMLSFNPPASNSVRPDNSPTWYHEYAYADLELFASLFRSFLWDNFFPNF